jgi:hypothetical protein
MKGQAEEVVGFSPDVIVVAGKFMLDELQRLTRTISIVFTTVSGPVESGFDGVAPHHRSPPQPTSRRGRIPGRS